MVTPMAMEVRVFPEELLTSIFPKELLTSMVYMGVKVTAYNGIYGDGVKVGATASVPH
jgi:hypothetical protein